MAKKGQKTAKNPPKMVQNHQNPAKTAIFLIKIMKNHKFLDFPDSKYFARDSDICQNHPKSIKISINNRENNHFLLDYLSNPSSFLYFLYV